jgi:hypothetical protein
MDFASGLMHSHRAVDQPSAFKSQNPPCPCSSSTCIPKCVPCTVSMLPRLTSPASMTFITGAGLVAASPPRARGAPRDLSEPAMRSWERGTKIVEDMSGERGGRQSATGPSRHRMGGAGAGTLAQISMHVNTLPLQPFTAADARRQSRKEIQASVDAYLDYRMERVGGWRLGSSGSG